MSLSHWKSSWLAKMLIRSCKFQLPGSFPETVGPGLHQKIATISTVPPLCNPGQWSLRRVKNILLSTVYHIRNCSIKTNGGSWHPQEVSMTPERKQEELGDKWPQDLHQVSYRAEARALKSTTLYSKFLVLWNYLPDMGHLSCFP